MNKPKQFARRDLLVMVAAGAGLALPAGARAAAAPLTDAEQANIGIVNAFCQSWAEHDIMKSIQFFTDDASYRLTETTAPNVGRAAILERFKSFVEQFGPQKIDFHVIDSVAKGPLVLNERVDTFVSPQRTYTYHLVGFFYVKDGKIAEWTDYILRP